MQLTDKSANFMTNTLLVVNIIFYSAFETFVFLLSDFSPLYVLIISVSVFDCRWPAGLHTATGTDGCEGFTEKCQL